MDSSRGLRRPPASDRLLPVASLLAAALCAAPVLAQPSPGLYRWLSAGDTGDKGARQTVLAPGPEAQAIPPGSVIGEVRVAAKDIFNADDPGENRKLFRFANHLHRTTRAGVIERQLLFKPGDVFNPELIAESARILRANDYLYDVDIRPVLRGDGKVDVEVTTRDVWTLQGGASFGRAGGRNSTSFSLDDSNFLGTGKEIEADRIGTVDRTSNLVRYTDPNLLGSRVRLLASYADNSDGGRQRLEVERPFYSLDTRWAAGVRGFHDDRLESLYTLGKAKTFFRHQTDFVEAYGGYSPGLVDGFTHRWEAGFTYTRDDFARTTKFPAGFGTGGHGKALNLFSLPPDRVLAYPWVRFESVQSRYVVEKDLDRIQRSEDLNLGRQYSLLLGLSSPTFGGDGTRWVAQTAISDGWRPTSGQIVLFQLGASTRWYQKDTENLVAGGRVRYYLRDLGSQVFYASLGADLAHRLDGEDQLLLGGDSGLRGYPLRYQAGDRRFLLTLEQRFYSDREIFHLVHLGAAAFFDAGQAWFVDTLTARDRVLRQERKILKDIGLGLRIASSRSSRGAVLHLDVAFPLDRTRSIQSVQWLISTGDTF
ncbi:MAG TPA: POTRA domain-containing protein [Thermoanaerobaculia bacterium]|nr:POTRA domain-containing protein [Thermoanaerobaculia bacterium]